MADNSMKNENTIAMITNFYIKFDTKYFHIEIEFSN